MLNLVYKFVGIAVYRQVTYFIFSEFNFELKNREGILNLLKPLLAFVQKVHNSNYTLPNVARRTLKQNTYTAKHWRIFGQRAIKRRAYVNVQPGMQSADASLCCPQCCGTVPFCLGSGSGSGSGSQILLSTVPVPVPAPVPVPVPVPTLKF